MPPSDSNWGSLHTSLLGKIMDKIDGKDRFASFASALLSPAAFYEFLCNIVFLTASRPTFHYCMQSYTYQSGQQALAAGRGGESYTPRDPAAPHWEGHPHLLCACFPEKRRLSESDDSGADRHTYPGANAPDHYPCQRGLPQTTLTSHRDTLPPLLPSVFLLTQLQNLTLERWRVGDSNCADADIAMISNLQNPRCMR